MKSNKAAVAGFCVAVPALLYAYASGPDPRHTAAPGDDQNACASSGCHVGTKVNAGGGSVALQFPNGSTYTPGQAQSITVVVSDSKQRVFGFQATARLGSNLSSGQAGDFTASSGQVVLCDDSTTKRAAGCRAAASVQFIEHSSPSSSGKWTISWTAPSSDVGPIHFYVAGNAANGDGNDTGDHIYTANYTLTAASTAAKPAISAGGVVSAAAFNPSAGVASGTWLEIYGSNLSSTTRGWGGGDFNGNNAPTSLDGVSVTVDGKAAFVDFVSPGQVNVQVPDGIGTGSGIQVMLSNSGGQSDPFLVTTSAIAPAVLAPPSFNVGGKQYAAALYADGATFVGKTNLIAGVPFRPAKPGDVITLYAIGLGPTKNGTFTGQIASGLNPLATTPTVLFGQTAATLQYAGLAPGFVGLYQLNIVVPNVSGDQQLSIQVNGTPIPQTATLTTQ